MALCPICPESILRAMRAGEVELDKCGTCEGLWIDVGTVEAYRSTQGSPTREALIPAYFSPSSTECKTCPRCNSLTLVPGGADKLRLLRCSGCGGVFLPKESPAADADLQPFDVVPIVNLVKRIDDSVDDSFDFDFDLSDF